MSTVIATSRHLQYDHEVRWHKQQGAVELREKITCRVHLMSAKDVQRALQENGKTHRYYVVRSVSFEAGKKHHPLNTPTQHVVYGVLITFVRPFMLLPRRSKPVQTEETGGLTGTRYKVHPYVFVLDDQTGRLSRVARQRLRELVAFDELAALLAGSDE
jgi:hypothetical protein